MSDVDLSIDLAGILLDNPIIAASGTFGYGEEFERFAELRRIGAICVKGTSARPIDGRLPASLVHLPPDITGALDDADHGSLAVRDLLRGTATALPSGEAVARAVGAQPLTAEETRLADHGWAGETPLWYYVLKEAEAREDGERLGPVGALIVGEVLVRIVDDDPGSHRCVDPSWRPTLPSREPDRFTLADLLAPHPVAGRLPVGMSPATAGTSTSRPTQDVGHRTG